MGRNKKELHYKNQSVKTSNKKGLSYPVILALLIVFIIIGFLLSNLIFNDNSISQLISKNNSVLHSYKDTGYNYQFINPLRQTSVFEKIFPDKLSNIDKLIDNYCSLLKTDKRFQQVSVYFKDLTNDQWYGMKENDLILPVDRCNILLLIAAFNKSEKDLNYLNKTLIYKGLHSTDNIATSLKIGTSYTVDNLIKLIATKSDGGAVKLLETDIGIDSLQSLQKHIGLKSTNNSNYISLKEYSSFFRSLYNANLLNRKNSQELLALLSQNEYDKGIRSAALKNIKISHEFTEIDTLVEYVKGRSFIMYHGGIVYYPGKPYFICIYIKGTNCSEMEKAIFNIAKIVFKEVDIQVRKFHTPNMDDDIN